MGVHQVYTLTNRTSKYNKQLPRECPNKRGSLSTVYISKKVSVVCINACP